MTQLAQTYAALLPPFLIVVALASIAVAINDAISRAIAARRIRRDVARGPWSPR